MLGELLLLLPVVAVLWLFHDGMRVRELALGSGRAYCERIGVQFLDETVCRQSIGLSRGAGGRLLIRRAFDFEFTSDGERRYRGQLTTLGMRVVDIQVELHRLLH